MNIGWIERLVDEVSQAWFIAVKDAKAYFMSPTTILWALLMPIAMWSCFVIRQNLVPESRAFALAGDYCLLLHLIGRPGVILLERRAHTYDRLLVAPMSLWTVIIERAWSGCSLG